MCCKRGVFYFLTVSFLVPLRKFRSTLPLRSFLHKESFQSILLYKKVLFYLILTKTSNFIYNKCTYVGVFDRPLYYRK